MKDKVKSYTIRMVKINGIKVPELVANGIALILAMVFMTIGVLLASAVGYVFLDGLVNILGL